MATPGRLLCTLSGVPTNSRGGFTPLTALHVGLEGPPDVPGGPEKPVIVVVGDAAGNVLVWSVPDGRPLSKLAVTEEEALSCFQQVGGALTCSSTLACKPVKVWSGLVWLVLAWLGTSLLCHLLLYDDDKHPQSLQWLTVRPPCLLVPLPAASNSAVAHSTSPRLWLGRRPGGMQPAALQIFPQSQDMPQAGAPCQALLILRSVSTNAPSWSVMPTSDRLGRWPGGLHTSSPIPATPCLNQITCPKPGTSYSAPPCGQAGGLVAYHHQPEPCNSSPQSR